MKNQSKFLKLSKGQQPEKPIGRMNALIYTRVACVEQTKPTIHESIEMQKRYCKNYAAKHNIKVVEYIDDTENKTYQEKLNCIINAIYENSKKISYILVGNYDRISRSVEELLYIISELGNLGITIIPVAKSVYNIQCSEILVKELISLVTQNVSITSTRIKSGIAKKQKEKGS